MVVGREGRASLLDLAVRDRGARGEIGSFSERFGSWLNLPSILVFLLHFSLSYQCRDTVHESTHRINTAVKSNAAHKRQ